MDAPLFVESDPVRNDGVDAHRARGASLVRLRQQQQQRPIMRDRSGTSPRLCRAVNRSNASASNRAMSPKQKRIGRLNTSTIWYCGLIWQMPCSRSTSRTLKKCCLSAKASWKG